MILPSSLVVLPRKGTRCWPHCGRRARPFSGRALREQGTSTGVLPPPLTFPSFRAVHRTHARTLCTECNRTRRRTHQIESPCRRNPGTWPVESVDRPPFRIAHHDNNRRVFLRSTTRCRHCPRLARRDSDG